GHSPARFDDTEFGRLLSETTGESPLQARTPMIVFASISGEAGSGPAPIFPLTVSPFEMRLKPTSKPPVFDASVTDPSILLAAHPSSVSPTSRKPAAPVSLTLPTTCEPQMVIGPAPLAVETPPLTVELTIERVAPAGTTILPLTLAFDRHVVPDT